MLWGKLAPPALAYGTSPLSGLSAGPGTYSSNQRVPSARPLCRPSSTQQANRAHHALERASKGGCRNFNIN